MKAQDYYREYQQKTLEMGFSPIGRQRFAGIIKTISTLDSTIPHIKEKQANEDNPNNESARVCTCLIPSVMVGAKNWCEVCQLPVKA